MMTEPHCPNCTVTERYVLVCFEHEDRPKLTDMQRYQVLQTSIIVLDRYGTPEDIRRVIALFREMDEDEFTEDELL